MAKGALALRIHRRTACLIQMADREWKYGKIKGSSSDSIIPHIRTTNIQRGSKMADMVLKGVYS